MAKLQKSIEKRNALLRATLCLVNSGGIQEASVAKVAKMAQVSPATIYLYFENKQDMVNQLYLSVKEHYATVAFKNYIADKPVKKSYEQIWLNMIQFKKDNPEESSFLSQCDNTPIIEEETRQKGLSFLQPLFDLWEKGKNEGIIKDVSPYIIYAFTIYPQSFLTNIEQRSLCKINKVELTQAFQAAWDSIKV
ncbi:TetR/AcrR family transcriptional regulator [Saccharicrinis aurantiacus]|uniref:TetR/AcrR family transcriptional regulator n=1 Tax=Saccharicrinis aurantiacus TaxID=1849719 RepID=UPI0008396E40|nr:TetR/AcrR family transcriptional regulator [Saccharicrinis aurantiacus]